MTNKELLEMIHAEVKSLNNRVSALEHNACAVSKSEAPRNGKKSTKKSSTKQTKTEEPKQTKKHSTALADFEPCTYKDSANYVWGGAKGYKSMRSAYCYAVQTKGEAHDLASAKAKGYTIDFDKKWAKAKADFEKKYKYVKACDR